MSSHKLEKQHYYYCNLQTKKFNKQSNVFKTEKSILEKMSLHKSKKKKKAQH